MLKVSGLSFAYPDRGDVLQSINLEVMAGEKIGVIGPNGAGKTTFFLCLCGVLKGNQGTIELNQIPIGGLTSELGLVFQNPDDQLFCPSVWDDVSFGPKNMGMSKLKICEITQTALEITGTAHLAQRPPHHLSGGEKRMVAIAAVLACDPKLIIYDEPSANLDSRSRRRLMQFLQTTDRGFLVASHDLELILEVCDRVILMDEGKIITDGMPPVVMSDQRLMATHGLERPHSLGICYLK